MSLGPIAPGTGTKLPELAPQPRQSARDGVRRRHQTGRRGPGHDRHGIPRPHRCRCAHADELGHGAGPSSICAAPNTDGIRTTATEPISCPSMVRVATARSALTMERAYIRFAGITAGSRRKTSADAALPVYEPYVGLPERRQAADYTATFGGGFSATVGIEYAGDFD